MRKFLFAFVSVIFLTGCDSRRIFEDNQEFLERRWLISKPVKFDFTIADPSKKYNVILNIRNSIDYPYARIFVNYDLLADSASLNKKMVAEYLFDQKSGKPLGTSGIGDIYDHQFPILKNYSFTKAGSYRMKFSQFMRMDTIPGILAVGVRVETAE